jgi:hypothetical protein
MLAILPTARPIGKPYQAKQLIEAADKLRGNAGE